RARALAREPTRDTRRQERVGDFHLAASGDGGRLRRRTRVRGFDSADATVRGARLRHDRGALRARRQLAFFTVPGACTLRQAHEPFGRGGPYARAVFSGAARAARRVGRRRALRAELRRQVCYTRRVRRAFGRTLRAAGSATGALA